MDRNQDIRSKLIDLMTARGRFPDDEERDMRAAYMSQMPHDDPRPRKKYQPPRPMAPIARRMFDDIVQEVTREHLSATLVRHCSRVLKRSKLNHRSPNENCVRDTASYAGNGTSRFSLTRASMCLLARLASNALMKVHVPDIALRVAQSTCDGSVFTFRLYDCLRTIQR